MYLKFDNINVLKIIMILFKFLLGRSPQSNPHYINIQGLNVVSRTQCTCDIVYEQQCPLQIGMNRT